MIDYLKIYELKNRFTKATTNTGINNAEFIIKQETIEISFVLNNENNYPVIFNKTFANTNELEEFIVLLEKLKIIAQSNYYQVQLIPMNAPTWNMFNIYINDELVNPSSINYYYQTSIVHIKNNLRNLISYNLATISRETAYLYLQINDSEENLNSCYHFINSIKSNSNPQQQHKLIKKQNPIAEYATLFDISKKYTIDLEKTLVSLKGYIQATDKNTKRKFEEEIIRIYNQIINAIKKGYIIDTNYFHIEKKLTSDDIHILIRFINNLEEIINKMKNHATTILDKMSKKFKAIQEPINMMLKENPNNILNFIKTIDINPSKKDDKDELNINYPLIYSLPYANYNHGKFNAQMNKLDHVFKDIQKQQLEKLTKEERDALIYYKSILYRPINAILALIRKKDITFEDAVNNQNIFEEILTLITNYYDEYIKRKTEIEKNPLPFAWRKTANPKSVERIFGKYKNNTPNKTEYTSAVLLAIPLLESALSKIETTEDIIVYRGTNGIGINDDKRLLSTSISLNIAKTFATNEERKENTAYNVFPDIHQIIIPKGSHVIAFTDDLFTDYYDESRTFNEEQQEILIDPQNFDFNITYINSSLIANEQIAMRINYIASPKAKNLSIKR